MFFKSIRFRIIIWYVIILTGILSLFSIILFNNFQSKLFSVVDSYLQANADVVSNSINNHWEQEKLKNPDILIKTKKYDETINTFFIKNIKNWSKYEQNDLYYINTLVRIFDNRAKLIFSSKVMDNIMSLSDAGQGNVFKGKDYYEDISVKTSSLEKMHLRLLTVPILKDKNLIYIIRVGTPLITLYSSLNILKLILFLLLPLTVLLTGVIGLFFAQITLRPLSKMISTIHHITAENLNLRLENPKTNDEIHKLADTFNDMLDRLDKSFTSQRRLIEDLSHEIKTPLSIIKGEIEVARKKIRTTREYEEILESNLEEINRIIIIAENLLLISRFESKVVKLNPQQIILNNLLSDIINDIRIIALEKNIKIDLSMQKNVIINCDQNQIKSLFLNLIDNAIKYTDKNGIIKFSLTKVNNFAKIEITDSGIGIPEDDLPYIFDRFYRTLRSNNKEKGFGLGLSIAKSIVDMHHGKIQVSSKYNKGTTVTIQLPFSF
jgi:heavy metal sensor kinase